MAFGEIVFYTVIGLFVFYVFSKLHRFIFKGTNEEQEYHKKLKESLADEFIIDPETGAKLTLEQAESGHWIAHDNEFNTISEYEIDKLFTEEQKNAERGINYLKEQIEYRKQNLNDHQIQILEKTKILSKYDDWSYSNSFKITYCDGFIFLPAVRLNGHSYYENDYHESQIMFWLKLNIDLGHYYLREKSKTEKIFELINSDDNFKLNNYELFTFKKTENIILLTNILKKIENEKGLEIEFFENNLFIKNTKFINTVDIFRIENIVKNIC
ncbi:hypothetical protein [Aquimarina rhabdastrellae]